MTFRAHRKPAAALLVLTFLVGLRGEAYLPHAAHGGAGDHGAVHSLALASIGTGESGPATSSPHHGDPGPCTCIGTCHGAAAAPLPALGFDGASLPAEAAGGEPGPPATRGLRSASPYLLPYANGPPTA